MCCNVPRQQYPQSSLRVSVVVGLFGGWFTWLLVVVFFFLFLCYLLKTLSLWEVSFFNIFHLFIYSYLAASGLSGSTGDLQSLLWHAGYFSCSIWDLCNLKPTRLLFPWDSSCKNTEVGCHALFQGIFPTQGLNPGLLPYRQILNHLSH